MIRHRMIRIFVSSTFRDFEEERNLLVREVFNRLETLCRDNGCSFQIVDLRWGITEADARDNLTLQICLDEIDRCRELSPRPNFLVLSGFRYGWIPLPAVIPDSEWQLLTGPLREGSDWLELLCRWYPRDYNSLHGDRILSVPAGASPDDLEVNRILGTLAREYLPADHPGRTRYGLSATEQEIYRGLFDVPDANTHTLVLMRTRPAANGESDEFSESDAQKVTRLRERLHRHMDGAAGGRLLTYSALGTEEIESAYQYLKGVILREIRRVNAEEAALSSYQREKRAQDEALSRSTYCDYGDSLSRLQGFCAQHAGQTVMVNGASGSGKTSLLMALARSGGRIAAAFPELVPSCQMVPHTLWFLLKQLEEQEVLAPVGEEPAPAACIPWFEEHLQQLSNENNTILLLDGVEQMSDWSAQNGTLFHLSLPANVTLIISCISPSSLRIADSRWGAPVFRVETPGREDALRLLGERLRLRGRRLTSAQEQEIRSILPAQISPLHLELLSIPCAGLHSLQEKSPLPASLRSLVLSREEDRLPLLMQQLTSEYPVLGSLALGYLSLCHIGLTEQELMDLLAQDPAIRREAEHTEWEFQDVRQVIAVPWSRLFRSMQWLLAETSRRGTLLLRLSHSLIRQTQRSRLHPEERRLLLSRLASYFEEQPYIHVNEQGQVLPNTRLLDELFSAYLELEDFRAISALLSDPEYIEAFLRDGRYGEILEQYQLLSEHRPLSHRQEQLLRLLRRSRLLLQHWPEAFLSEAAGRGLCSTRHLKEHYHMECFLAGNNPYVRQESIWDDGMYLPGCHGEGAAALRDGRYYAIREGQEIRICDWALRAVTEIHCTIPDGGGAMYWDGNHLIVRQQKSRLTLLFDPERRELVLEKKESCPDYEKLFLKERDGDTPAFREAGGVRESDAFLRTSSRFSIWYNGRMHPSGLTYPSGTGKRISLLGHRAAVVVNMERLEVIDLSCRRLQAVYPCHGAWNAVWSPSGGELLLLSEDGHVALLRVPSDSEGLHQPIPDLPKKEPEDESLLQSVLQAPALIQEVTSEESPEYPDLVMHPVYRCGLPYTRSTSPWITDRRPLLAAFSIRGNWLALYYYYNTEAVLRLYRCDSRTLYAECLVDPVYRVDMTGQALFASEDGCAVWIRSGGRLRRWDTRTLVWSMPKETETSRPDDVQRRIQEQYAAILLPDRPGKAEPDRPAAFRLLPFLSLLVHLVPDFTKNPGETQLSWQRLSHVPVIKQNGRYWILNREDGLVHVCDADARFLAHAQFDGRVLAFDVCRDTVYALTEELGELQTRRLDVL